jgi:hypothetical protein
MDVSGTRRVEVLIPEGFKKLAGGQGAKRRHPRYRSIHSVRPWKGRRSHDSELRLYPLVKRMFRPTTRWFCRNLQAETAIAGRRLRPLPGSAALGTANRGCRRFAP